MTHIETMKQLLDDMLDTLPYNSPDYWMERIRKVRQAIEQAEQAQPVAWRWENGGEDKWLNKYIYLDNGGPDCPEDCEPLYTATPPRPATELRKPLTDDEIKLVMDGRGEEGDDDYVKPAFDPFGISEDDLMNFARAIEAAHGIKGEA